ncbi:SAP domain protein [Dictyocaulus viviparus]|uniref:SAP domain protein n=1 Tax=Dictyocaulus viviparus TaxID=29172 RepID=A0A0D8XTR4_DICVI|nr:SAP domain protein [Dictyocaulus viviparus]
MSLEDPLVNGIPLSSLRVVDLRDELDKRGLSKIGNKSVLTERLKAYICENELQNCDETSMTEKSTTEKQVILPMLCLFSKFDVIPYSSTLDIDSTPENPLVAAYLAQRIRKEENSDDVHENEAEENIESVKEQATTGNDDEKYVNKTSSSVKEDGNNTVITTKEPRHSLSEEQTEVDEIIDEEIGKTATVVEDLGEEKQSDDESTQYSQKNESVQEKVLVKDCHNLVECEKELEGNRHPSKGKVSSAPKQEENGGSGGENLEELDYGEVDAEADVDMEEREAKDEFRYQMLELDDSEDREIQKQRRQLEMAIEESHAEKGEKKRKVSPSRHPESEIIHIRGLTRPFTDRALKGEIVKCGGQIVDFWIDSVKSHCIVQMGSIEEAREVRNSMHNTQWPAANPKTLSVQFDTKENLERHRSGLTPASSCYPLPATRSERKLSERERPTIGHLPGRNPSLKITVEAAMRENEKREETREKERRERARMEKDTDARREDEEEKKEKREDKQISEEKHSVKKDEHDRKRHRSETPPFSRSVIEKRERRDSYSRPEYDRDRDYSRKRDDDRGRHRHHESEKEKEREEKPIKTADSLFMKTKTLPAIYFLPLTDEEVAERQEKILAEKKKREHKEQEREKEKSRR